MQANSSIYFQGPSRHYADLGNSLGQGMTMGSMFNKIKRQKEKDKKNKAFGELLAKSYLMEGDDLKEKGVGAARKEEVQGLGGLGRLDEQVISNGAIDQDMARKKSPGEIDYNKLIADAAQIGPDAYARAVAMRDQYEGRESKKKLNELKSRLTDAKIKQLSTPFDQSRDAQKMRLQARLKSRYGKGGGPKRLSSSETRRVAEAQAIPAMLGDIKNTIKNNLEVFGPIEGRARSLNPYDTQAKTIQSQMKAASQAFGRYMEGGVLRKEDEEKYREMFPQLSDTPEVATNKLAIVSRLLAQKQEQELNALQGQGYDLAGFKRANLEEIPREVRGDSQGRYVSPQGFSSVNQRAPYSPVTEPAIINKAYAGERGGAMNHPQSREAYQWAIQNKGDPKAKEILRRLGGE